MSHEKSITIRDKKGFVNIPTVVNGKDVGAQEAERLFRAGKLRPLGGSGFQTLGDAIKEAKRRSRSFD